jgi:hypothetical protein
MGVVRALLQRGPDDVVAKMLELGTGRLHVTVTTQQGTDAYDANLWELYAEADAIVGEIDAVVSDLRIGLSNWVEADHESTHWLRRVVDDAEIGQSAHARFDVTGRLFIVIRDADGTPADVRATEVVVKSPRVRGDGKRPGLVVRSTTPKAKRTT